MASISSDFGHWFAGFLDGEGYFGIEEYRTRVSRQLGYQPTMTLHLRADDAALIAEIRRQLGFGAISFHHYPSESKMRNPTVRYSVRGTKQCARLLAVLELHPLRSKKKRDFELWALAIRERQRGKAADQELLRQLYVQIKEIRRYRSTPVSVSPPRRAQLKLIS